MKKTFIFFLVLVATAVQAEEREERDFFFVRAGVSLNKIAGKDAGNSKVCPLYDISLNYQKTLTDEVCPIYYTPQIAFGTRGEKESSDTKMETGYIKSHNIRLVPLQFSVQPRIVPERYLDIHAGGYLSVDYAGIFTYEQGTVFVTNEADKKIGDIENYHRLDAGIQVGAGLWMGSWNLDFTYRRGFIGIIKDYSAFTNNFIVCLGYSL